MNIKSGTFNYTVQWKTDVKGILMARVADETEREAGARKNLKDTYGGGWYHRFS